MTGPLKAFQTAVFGLPSISWPGSVRTTVRRTCMVGASANRTLFPAINDVEDKGGMDGYCGVQRRGKSSGAIPYARYRLSGFARGSQRHSAPIACNHITG